MARNVVTRAQLRKSEHFEVLGLDAAYDKLDAILNRVSAEGLKEHFLGAAQFLRDRIRDSAPIRMTRLGRKPAPGQLRRAIFAARGRSDKPDALVGVNRKIRGGVPVAPHGRLLEYGTSKMSARPFFRPAVNTYRSAVSRMVADAIAKTIEQFK